jgi:hypothetical protein
VHHRDLRVEEEDTELVSWKGSIFWEEIRQEQYGLVKSGERKNERSLTVVTRMAKKESKFGVRATK